MVTSRARVGWFGGSLRTRSLREQINTAVPSPPCMELLSSLWTSSVFFSFCFHFVPLSHSAYLSIYRFIYPFLYLSLLVLFPLFLYFVSIFRFYISSYNKNYVLIFIRVYFYKIIFLKLFYVKLLLLVFLTKLII